MKDSYTKFVDLCDAKIEINVSKKTITQDNIYVVWKFFYGNDFTFQGKIQDAAVQFFFSQNNTPNPNLTSNDIYILHCGFRMGQASAP